MVVPYSNRMSLKRENHNMILILHATVATDFFKKIMYKCEKSDFFFFSPIALVKK